MLAVKTLQEYSEYFTRYFATKRYILYIDVNLFDYIIGQGPYRHYDIDIVLKINNNIII